MERHAPPMWKDLSSRTYNHDVAQVVQTNMALDAAKVDADKSQCLADSIRLAWQFFCTSSDGHLDQELYEHILSCIYVWSSDRCPGAMKAARIFRQSCAHLQFINKDPCHVIRTVTNLVSDSFRTAEDILFQDKTAVIPRITNSCEWKAKFVWLEKFVLENQNFDCALRVAVRHFNYAATRWESSACPRRRCCHLIVPTALLLAVAASDARCESKERKRLPR